MKIGYIRVSTKEQNIELQESAMLEAKVERIFIEKISALKERPELEKMQQFCRKGDTIVVWKMDRIARSLKNLITLVEDWNKKGVHFVSITEQVDTQTPMGKFFLHIIGAFSEFERNIIIERTLAGLKTARAKGRIGGRRKGLSKEARKKAELIKVLYLDEEKNYTADEICKMFGIGSKATLYRYLRELGIMPNRKRGRRKNT